MITGNNFHHMRFFLNSELNALYVSLVIRSLAFSMVGIFVPIYLFFELNYSFNSILTFFIIYSLAFLIISLTTYRLMDLLSFKYTILLTSPFYVAYFILLDFLQINPWIFFIPPILMGIADGIYWPAFHYEFSGVSDYKKRGKEVGYIFNFSLLAGLIGPLLGGGILLFSGFSLLFICVLLLLIGSALPMFFTHHKNKIANVRFKDIFAKNRIRDMIAFIGKGGILTAEGLFWPIFIFAFFKGYLKTGSLFTGISIVTIFFIFLISKLSDSYPRRDIIKIGTLFHAVSWLFSFFITNIFNLIGVFVFRNFASVTMDVPFLALTYDKSKNKADYFVLREVFISVGRILFLLLVMWFGSLGSSFILASGFSLLHLFL